MNEEKNLYDLESLNLPYSVEAEQSVLGAMISDPQCIIDIAPILSSEFFYLPQHKKIFEVMLEMYDKSNTIDFVSLLEKLKSENVYDEAGGKSYLTQLVQVVPTSKNVMTYVGIMKDKYYSRALLGAAQGIIKDVNENAGDVEQLIEDAEQRIFDIRDGREVTGLTHIKSILQNETCDRLSKMADPETKADYIGIPTGIGALDRKIGGLNKSDLIILGARPGMGKTSFALNVASHVALKEKRKVCFFSLEMTRDQIGQRLLSANSGVSSEKFRLLDLMESKDWIKIATSSEELSQMELYIDETSAITVPQMKAKLRRMGKVDLVIVDYLGLMHSARRIDNRVQEISEITRGLKLMAKELRVPVLVCAQLSRNTEQKGKSHKPALADLRDSGSIEQDADIVLFLYRENYYDSEKGTEEELGDPNKAECIIAKNRHGEVGNVELYWDAKLTRYTSVDGTR